MNCVAVAAIETSSIAQGTVVGDALVKTAEVELLQATTISPGKYWLLIGGDVAPVLAVEVLSPNDRPGRVDAKVRQYLDAGTRVVWLIDSDDRTVAVYRPGRDFQILKRDEILSGEPELPEFQCVVSHLFLQPGEFPA